jgi:hypothetical protein
MPDEAESDDDGVLDFFKKNAPSPGCVDLFLLGDSRTERNAYIAALLRMFRNEDRPAFTSITIVLTPGNDGSALLAELKTAFSEGWRRCTGHVLPPAELEKAFRVVNCAVSETLEAGSLVDVVGRGARERAYVVANAASYRTSGSVSSSYNSALPEDFWVGHLHVLTSLLRAAAETSLTYVVMDAGEYLPDRPEHRDLLHTTRDGLLGIGRQERNGLELAQQFERCGRPPRKGAWVLCSPTSTVRNSLPETRCC